MSSANSLATRLGGTAGGVGLGALAGSAGIPAALAVAAAVLAAAAPLYRVAGRPAPDLSVPASGGEGFDRLGAEFRSVVGLAARDQDFAAPLPQSADRRPHHPARRAAR